MVNENYQALVFCMLFLDIDIKNKIKTSFDIEYIHGKKIIYRSTIIYQHVNPFGPEIFFVQFKKK